VKKEEAGGLIETAGFFFRSLLACG